MNEQPTVGKRRAIPVDEYFLSLAIVAVSTVVSLVLRQHLNATNLAMVYFVGVVIIASRCSKSAAMLTSVLSVAAFDYFFVPPYNTFVVTQYEYLITLAVMLIVALLISAMTAQIRLQTAASVEREIQTAALYRLSVELAGRNRAFDIAKSAAALAEETF